MGINDVEMFADLPEPPEFLNDVAKKEWFRLGKILLDQKIITKNDTAVFAAYCSSYSDFVWSIERVNGLEDRMSRTAQGETVHPYVRMSREAKIQMLSFAKELGLSPKARGKINVSKKPKKKPGSLADFMSKKKA